MKMSLMGLKTECQFRWRSFRKFPPNHHLMLFNMAIRPPFNPSPNPHHLRSFNAQTIVFVKTRVKVASHLLLRGQHHLWDSLQPSFLCVLSGTSVRFKYHALISPLDSNPLDFNNFVADQTR